MIKTPITSRNGQDSQSWKEVKNGISDMSTSDGKYPRHELLGSRVVESHDGEPSWRNILETKKVPWLAEHVLLNQTIFPAAGYISMAGESMQQISNGKLESYTLRDFTITSALLLRPSEKVELHTRLRPVRAAEETEQWYEIQITSYDGSHHIERCVGKVSPQGTSTLENSQVPYPRYSLPRRIAPSYWYDVAANVGLQYGPVFHGLSEISTSITDLGAVATISFEETTKYILHPVAIDQCFQLLMIAAYQGQGRKLKELSVPTFIKNLIVTAGWGEMRIGGKAARIGSGGFSGDATVISEKGLPILSMKGYRASAVPSDISETDSRLFSFTEWETDATLCNLNQVLTPPGSELDPFIVLARTIKILVHKNPKLRILELGTGRDETTRLVLNALKSQYGERLYLSYTYAGTSSDALEKAKELFKETSNVEVLFFDVEANVQNPSLKPGSYDLIITTDFFVPTRDITVCLNHLKPLLQTLGRLLTLETLPGASEDENFISQVHTSLLDCGFEFGPEDDSHLISPRFVAELKKPSKYPKKITLVIPEDYHPLVNAIQTSLEESGIDCESCTFEDGIPQGQDIISLVDFGEPYVHNLTEAKFRGFINRLSSFRGSMIWVTPIAQISCENPNSSMIIGLTRTLRAELRKDITVVEVDAEVTASVDSSKALLEIYQGLSHRPKAKDVDPDYEYAIVDGEIKIPRLHWTTGKEELAHYAEQLKSAQNDLQSLAIPNTISTTSIRFRSDACYLLVGGLGGLGRAISTWMVENGARNLLFLSRSAKEGPETTPFFDELRSQGCLVLTYTGNVTSLTDVVAAVKQTTRPIAGVMQMAAVMRDNWMSHMTFSEWEQCVQPKVQGTWNLHQIVSSAELDFFLLFSSICGVSGQWGQANYNAANTFLDAFVQYRHGQNLPASVVDIGFMGSIGMAVENTELNKKLITGGYYFLCEQELIDGLTIALANSRPGNDPFLNKSQLGLGLRSTKAMANATTRVAWKKDARMAISHHFDAFRTATDEEVKRVLDIAYQDQKSSD